MQAAVKPVRVNTWGLTASVDSLKCPILTQYVMPSSVGAAWESAYHRWKCIILLQSYDCRSWIRTLVWARHRQCCGPKDQQCHQYFGEFVNPDDDVYDTCIMCCGWALYNAMLLQRSNVLQAGHAAMSHQVKAICILHHNVDMCAPQPNLTPSENMGPTQYIIYIMFIEVYALKHTYVIHTYHVQSPKVWWIAWSGTQHRNCKPTLCWSCRYVLRYMLCVHYCRTPQPRTRWRFRSLATHPKTPSPSTSKTPICLFLGRWSKLQSVSCPGNLQGWVLVEHNHHSSTFPCAVPVVPEAPCLWNWPRSAFLSPSMYACHFNACTKHCIDKCWQLWSFASVLQCQSPEAVRQSSKNLL